MQEQSGIQIGQRVFIQSLAILFALMLLAGTLTLVVPSGQYQRIEAAGRSSIDPASFSFTDRPDYPAWRWLTAPIEVLGAEGSLVLIVIILFLLMVGAAFAVLEKSGLVQAALSQLVNKYAAQKYTLLLIITFFFMALGSFFGILEEMVPLVPLMIALSYSLGWDALTGLGMSVLATNIGFSAAITNPFTIGVAQQLAGLPLFSGAELRIPLFIVMYLLLAFFLVQYARRIEKNPEASLVFNEDRLGREKYAHLQVQAGGSQPESARAAMLFLGGCLALILLVLVASPFVEFLTEYALPMVGLLFFVAGIGAGLLSGAGAKTVWRAAGQGLVGILPAIPLILMAASVRHIVAQGGILDTLLYTASGWFAGASPLAAALAVMGLALFIEFFIASGSAKAFLIMPLLLPLADLVGVTAQTTVSAYCFGDGFSNLAYPTNPILLIILGLAGTSYTKWMRWSLPLWGLAALVTVAFLAVAVTIGYGPF